MQRRESRNDVILLQSCRLRIGWAARGLPRPIVALSTASIGPSKLQLPSTSMKDVGMAYFNLLFGFVMLPNETETELRAMESPQAAVLGRH